MRIGEVMNGPSAKNVKDFRLIDCGWIKEFQAASKLKADELFVISPFIKLPSVKRLTAGKEKIQVLTRFALSDFFDGVSDLSALRYLLKRGAEVRGIKYLHSKLYVFGQQRAILTSANL